MKKIFLAMAIAIVTGTAVSAQDDDKEDKIVVSTHQTDKEDGYEGHSASRCGIKFNFQLIGVTKVELESVDGFPLAGTATTQKTAQGKTAIDDMVHTSDSNSSFCDSSILETMTIPMTHGWCCEVRQLPMPTSAMHR